MRKELGNIKKTSTTDMQQNTEDKRKGKKQNK